VQFGIVAGVACGLLFLLNPSSVMVALAWIAFLIARRKVALAHTARYGGVLLASLLLIASAWALRNRYQLGAAVIRTNLGMTLYASNNDCAESSMIETEKVGCYQSRHPNASLSEARLLSSLGEVEYDRLRTADAKRWAMAAVGKALLGVLVPSPRCASVCGLRDLARHRLGRPGFDPDDTATGAGGLLHNSGTTLLPSLVLCGCFEREIPVSGTVAVSGVRGILHMCDWQTDVGYHNPPARGTFRRKP
jgi:hypothetical protein